jgi:hypothetical protein
MLQTQHDLTKIIPNCSINFFRNESISNQFYWGHSLQNGWLAAVGESTIKGVLGGIVSMQILSLLKETVIHQHIVEPNTILDTINKKAQIILSGNESKNALPPSISISICVYDVKQKVLQYAGANSFIGLLQTKNGCGKIAVNSITGNTFKLDSQVPPNGVFQKHVLRVDKNDTLFMLSGIEKLKFASQPIKRAIVNIAFHNKSTIDAQTKVVGCEIRKAYQNSNENFTVLGVRL